MNRQCLDTTPQLLSFGLDTVPPICSLETLGESSQSAISANDALILVADDDDMVRLILRQGFEHEGYRVIEARDGATCLAAYEQFHPDLIVLDARMPVLDGFTCCQELRSRRQHRQQEQPHPPEQAVLLPDVLPILIITAFNDSAAINQAFSVGATDYIPKPIHWTLLRQRVQHLLHNSRATAALANQVEHLSTQLAIATQQPSHYQAAQTRIAELENLNQVKDDFLNMIAHELRSPATNMRIAIQGALRFISQGRMHCGHFADRNSECTKSVNYLHILQHECERQIDLINDVLDLQRLEAGQQQLDLDIIDLNDWIATLIEPFQERVNHQQQSLVVQLASNLPPLMCDATSLQRVLTELLQNACKYTPPCERITVSISAFEEYVQLCVSNSGIEILPAELSRIFDKFYRIPGGDRWHHGGTGLGLSLVQQLVNHLGGSIRVESATGETSFTIELPLKSAV